MSTRISQSRPVVVHRPVRRRRWPWVLAAALILALIGSGYYVLRWTAVLGVKDVAVEGVSNELAGAVRAAVGVDAGTPLITVDTAAAADRILADVPEIESASVLRQWPNTLAVSVRTRTAVAVTQANGSWWLLDVHGVVYRKVPTPPAGLMPIQLATPGPGDAATVAAVEVITHLPKAIRAEVATVVAGSPFAITFQLLDGREVVWGDSGKLAEKSQVLPVVLQQPGRHYDISDPTLVTVR